ncbi:hypothetical protein V1512DRAFT_129144 [Lipomyces arxii]|uniref:uncharacterized protein n=1 Tax=Lipomyces arxii TaxID=56418 RepID=UPI0034CD4CA2
MPELSAKELFDRDRLLRSPFPQQSTHNAHSVASASVVPRMGAPMFAPPSRPTMSNPTFQQVSVPKILTPSAIRPQSLTDRQNRLQKLFFQSPMPQLPPQSSPTKSNIMSPQAKQSSNALISRSTETTPADKHQHTMPSTAAATSPHYLHSKALANTAASKSSGDSSRGPTLSTSTQPLSDRTPSPSSIDQPESPGSGSKAPAFRDLQKSAQRVTRKRVITPDSEMYLERFSPINASSLCPAQKTPPVLSFADSSPQSSQKQSTPARKVRTAVARKSTNSAASKRHVPNAIFSETDESSVDDDPMTAATVPDKKVEQSPKTIPASKTTAMVSTENRESRTPMQAEATPKRYYAVRSSARGGKKLSGSRRIDSEIASVQKAHFLKSMSATSQATVLASPVVRTPKTEPKTARDSTENKAGTSARKIERKLTKVKASDSAPPENGFVRRSGRIRVKPLDFWKNERIIYGLSKSSQVGPVPTIRRIVRVETDEYSQSEAKLNKKRRLTS